MRGHGVCWQVVVKKPGSTNHGDGIIHEALALSALKHPHVVRLIGISLTTKPMLWLEYCSNGDLHR